MVELHLQTDLTRGVVHLSNHQMRSTMYIFHASISKVATCDGVVRANSVDDALELLREYFASEVPGTVAVRILTTSVTVEITL